MHARKAKLKTHLVLVKQHVTPRRFLLLAAAACSASLVLLTLRALHYSAAASARAGGGGVDDSQYQQQQQVHDDCAKKKVVPDAVAQALVHYATSNDKPPPLTEAEASAAARVLLQRAPCNLLVFGIDAGGPLWATLNHDGRTMFLDADADRVAASARAAGLDIDAHHVAYYQDNATSLSDSDILALRDSPDCTSSPTLSPEHFDRSPCKLAPGGLPATFFDVDWDVIVVNSPVPSAVYAAGVAARARRPEAGETTHVVVHGVDAASEERFVRAFLCEGYFKEEAGRTRHFDVPSRRDKDHMPFCP
ncbi:hypothetical protein PR202_gb02212 [Eleusine coracana subsp. coracana]|uniref:Polysaccharide biosynthesis domain-containing protein n=1 Tax=Eleusine coracana subsp. coracana TaxID=191504 RepID=A0AAV5DYH0_ELECO|nr:hypothetical protein PR202_gb02212 [Eleusine coracana subsp. coracana]